MSSVTGSTEVDRSATSIARPVQAASPHDTAFDAWSEQSDMS